MKDEEVATMKKICFVSHEAKMYGAPRSLLLIIENIDLSKFEISVICFGNGMFVENAKKIGIPVYVLPILVRNTFFRKIISKLKLDKIYGLILLIGILLKIKPDLVYVNTIAKVRPILIAKVLGIRTIVHVRETSSRYFSSSGVLLGELRKRIKTKWPDRYICVSNAVKSVLIENHVDINKIQVIYNGIDVEKFRGSSIDKRRLREELGISANDFVVGFVGQLCHRKGIDFLIDISRDIVSHYIKCKILIVGGPVDSSYVKSNIMPLINKNKLKEHVVFTDYVSNVMPYYSIFDIFVITSRDDPFPRVNLEAMAMELPIVATNVDGNIEAVCDGVTGYLVPFGDKKAFSKRVIELIENKDLRDRYGLNGYERVSNYFSLNRTVRSVELEIKKML